jgi:uncharacterized protein Veg
MRRNWKKNAKNEGILLQKYSSCTIVRCEDERKVVSLQI